MGGFFGPGVTIPSAGFFGPLAPPAPPAGNWTLQPAFPLNHIAGFTSSATRVVMTDGNGNGAYSDDKGVSWTACTGFTASNDGFAVAYNGAGLWVAASRNGQILTSATGAAWANSASIAPIFGNPSIQFGNGFFMVCTQSSAQNVDVYTSPDGVTWTNHGTATPNQIKLFGFNGSSFFGQSLNINNNNIQVASSADGTTWVTTDVTQFNSAGGIHGMALGGGIYVATYADFSPAAQSSPSTIWVGTDLVQPLTDDVAGVAFKGGLWVLIGDVLGGTVPQAATSTDLSTWTLEDLNIGAAGFENMDNCATLANTVMAWSGGLLSTRN